MGYVQGQGLTACASPSGVYLAGKLQWRALLVVSVLDIFYDCHLSSLLQSWGRCWGFLWGLWVFVGLGGLVGCVRVRGLGVWASAAGVYPAGGLQWRFGHGLSLPFGVAFAVLGGY